MVVFKLDKRSPLPQSLSFESNGFHFHIFIIPPENDFLLYFCDISFFDHQNLIVFNVSINIEGSKNEKQILKSTIIYTQKNPYQRLSGILNEFNGEITVNLMLTTRAKHNFMGNNINKFNFSIVNIENLKGSNIYENQTITEFSDKIKFDATGDAFISLPYTNELIGPIKVVDIKKYLVANHVLLIFFVPFSVLAPKSISKNPNKIVFFVEKENEVPCFFGVYRLDSFYNVFSAEYNNFTINMQPFDPNTEYPSGSIIYGVLKHH